MSPDARGPGLCIAQVPDKDEQSLASIQTSIEELIEPLAVSNNYSGSVLIYKNGKEFFSKSYGSQDREKEIKNTAESKFFLASVSAMFSVTITLRKNRLFADGGPLLPIDEGLGEPIKFIHRKYWSTLEFVGDKDGNTVELNFDQFKGRKIK